MRPSSFVVYVVIFISLLSTYLGLRLIRRSGLSLPVQASLWAALIAAVVLAMAINFVIRMPNPPYGKMWFDSLLVLAFLDLGFLSYLMAFQLFRDLIELAVVFPLSKTPLVGLMTSSFPLKAILTLSPATVVGVSVLLTGLGWIEEMKGPKIEEVEVRLAGLPPELEGLTIVQVTDLHLGPTLRRGFVERVVETMRALNPDIAVVTGDLADGYATQIRDITAPLKGITAKLGVFYVTGNHEYYWGVQDWTSAVGELGITNLENRGIRLTVGGRSFYLAGVTDYGAGLFDPAASSDPVRAVQGARRDELKILLAHQPKSAPAAAQAGFDLMISGHTHGGQYFPWNLIVGFFQPFSRGLGQQGKMAVYVSRGTGYWGPPLRLGVRAEITRLVLTGKTTGPLPL